MARESLQTIDLLIYRNFTISRYEILKTMLPLGSKSVKKVPLRLVLVVPFVLQISTAVGIVGYLSFRNGHQAVNDLAHQLMNKVNRLVDQHLDTYLATPHQVNQINADVIEQGLLNTGDLQGIGHFFWKQMQLYDFSYINYGLVTGEYSAAGHLEGDVKASLSETSPNTKGKNYNYATDSQGNRTKMIAVYEDYDHRTEAWYIDAVRAGKPVWSQVYLWDSTPEYVAIAASRPIYDDTNKLIGAVSVDLLLSNISDFLRKLEASPSGKTFIVERDGLVIASSSSEKPFTLVNGKAQRLNALKSSDSLIQATTQYLEKKFGNFKTIKDSQELDFQFKGERQFVRITPWRDKFGLDWLVIVVVPESDFMAQINANTNTTILLCLGALALATGLGIYTSRWIAQPILRLSAASSEIASGNLEQTVDIKGVKELSILAQSFNRMAGQLQESFTALEKTNEELEKRVERRTAELKKAKESADVANQAKSEFLANMSHELRKAQLRLVQEEKMSALGQLVAGVAHEINNPVNFIYGNLSHAQRDVDDLLKLLHLYQAYTPEPIPEIQSYSDEIDLDFLESDLPQLIHSMQVGAERILEIVRSLKIFSRLDRTKSQPVNLHELIDSTLMLLSSRLRSKSQHSDFRRPDIEVVKEYGELPFVESNAGQLSQVFMNLLTNAIDAINEKFENGENIQTIQTAQTQDFIPRIIIRTEITPDQLNAVIRIKDNGIGMTEDVRQRMFEQFFTTKPVGQGTGLGLSITRQIVVVKHGGTLEVNSTRGEGSEFVITLPVKFEHD